MYSLLGIDGEMPIWNRITPKSIWHRSNGFSESSDVTTNDSRRTGRNCSPIDGVCSIRSISRWVKRLSCTIAIYSRRGPERLDHQPFEQSFQSQGSEETPNFSNG